MQKEICDFLSVIEKKVNKPSGIVEEKELPVSSSAFKQYHSNSIEYRERLHLQLNEITRQQDWLTLEFEPAGFDDHSFLKRVKVSSTRSMLLFMGVEVISERIKRSIIHVIDRGLKLPDRFSNLKSLLEKTWQEGKQFYGCSYDASDRLIDALTIVEFLHQHQNIVLLIDYRTLSVRLFQSSKRLETLVSTVAKLLRSDTPDLDDIKPDSILNYWGLFRFPPLFRFKGNILIETQAGILDTSQVWPFLALPPDGILAPNFNQQPSYVIFIENKTTFERYCREISDRGLVFYTNGFPSKQWQRLYKQIDSKLSEDTPFFHWGDIDIGGFKIFSFMSHLLKHDIRPHMMDHFIEETGNNGIKANDLLVIIEGVKSSSVWHKTIIDALKKVPDRFVRRIEQETLDIKTPL